MELKYPNNLPRVYRTRFTNKQSELRKVNLNLSMMGLDEPGRESFIVKKREIEDELTSLMFANIRAGKSRKRIGFVVKVIAFAMLTTGVLISYLAVLSK